MLEIPRELHICILNAKSLVALFISLQDLGRKYKYTNSYMNFTAIILNCHFCN